MTLLAPTTTIAHALRSLLGGEPSFRITAYDGSTAGPDESRYGLDLRTERGLAYLVTAPGDLGLVRAYVMGDLDLIGVHPGDPYEALVALKGDGSGLRVRAPSPVDAIGILRTLGLSHLRPPAVPPQEHVPRWRRVMDGMLHSPQRDAEAIHHHYDVSNRFYELVLGPSMTYTCACFPSADATLEQAQEHKYDLVCQKLALKPGQRLLDVGCGWGGMVRHAVQNYGVTALGVTLSMEQAAWASVKIKELDLQDRAEVRHLDYREVTEGDFDAISSIGLTEHIGAANYPAYFGFLLDKLKPHGRLLNHCITRPHNRPTRTGPFIDRYVFPDAELTGSGRIITAMQNAGWEVQHEENLRMHYAMTLAGWNRNLVENWDECVAEVGEGAARVWGLYMAGSRLGFAMNELQLHQVLATKTDADGVNTFPLRPDWTP
jgi:cyclopropane-fatty-acyl-phospholipid synthase